jgi:hypothetical protein
MTVSVIDERNLKFIVDVITEIKKDTKGNDKVYDHVVIKLKNTVNNQSRIHPYTEFLDCWSSKSTNTRLKYANDIVPFLNYIYFELDEKILPSINELTIELGVDYLNRLGLDKKKNTVKAITKSITKFYYFLVKKKVLKYVTYNDFTKHKNATICQAFEVGLRLPIHMSNTTPLHNIDENLIFEFIYTAMKYTPEIALGIYFQIFGGLRVGEVCNLTYQSIAYINEGHGGLILNVKNNNLRPDLKKKAYVKTPGKQPVYAVGSLLVELLEIQKKKYSNKEKYALFIDIQGKAMSVDTYRNRFNTVKRQFIENLKKQDNPLLIRYAAVLSAEKWSTHIGRSIYSNLVADHASNITEIAVKRRDSNLTSSLTYVIGTKELDKKLLKTANKILGNIVNTNK